MELSKNNLQIATEYLTGNTTLFNTKDDDYKNLFMSFITDNNSSTVREAVTIYFLGYTQHSAKHGADGINPKTKQEIEVKPKYIPRGKRLSSTVGNFNDMTMELLEKKRGYSIVGSLFSDENLIYVVEFPIEDIFEVLKKPIINAKIGKRVVCPFSYKNYDTPNLVVHYFNREAAKEIGILSKPHTDMLNRHYVDTNLPKQKKFIAKNIR